MIQDSKNGNYFLFVGVVRGFLDEKGKWYSYSTKIFLWLIWALLVIFSKWWASGGHPSNNKKFVIGVSFALFKNTNWVLVAGNGIRKRLLIVSRTMYCQLKQLQWVKVTSVFCSKIKIWSVFDKRDTVSSTANIFVLTYELIRNINNII